MTKTGIDILYKKICEIYDEQKISENERLPKLSVQFFADQMNDLVKENLKNKERWKRIEYSLVEYYDKDRVAVANICDEVLDKSGGLLGRVRFLHEIRFKKHRCLECEKEIPLTKYAVFCEECKIKLDL